MASLKPKQTAIKKLSFLFLLIFQLFYSYGQEDLYNWKIGTSAGFQNLDKGISLMDAITPADFGIELGKSISPSFVISAGFIYNADLANRIYSSLLFHSDNGWFLSERSRWSPIAGIGVHYDGSDPVKLEIAGEAGLKLRISDRISSTITYLTYFPGSDLRNLEFSGSHNQTIKLSLNYHFGEKKSNYKSPVFYAGAFLNYPGDSISGSINDYILKSEEKLLPETDAIVTDTLVIRDTISRVGIADTSLVELPLAIVADSLSSDSLSISNDTLSVGKEKIPSPAIPDSLESQKLVDTTKLSTAPIRIPRDTFQKDSLRSYQEYPDSLMIPVIKDSIVEKPSTADYQGSIVVNNNFNVIINDSTVSIQVDDKQALVIKLQPQYVFAPKEIPAGSPQAMNIPASKLESQGKTAATSQGTPAPLPTPQTQVQQPASPQPVIGTQQFVAVGKGPDSLLLEQNRLLFEILAKLSVPSSTPESQVLLMPVEKAIPDTVFIPADSVSQKDTIIDTGVTYSKTDSLSSIDTITESVIPRTQPVLDKKIEILENRLRTLNSKLEELSREMENLQNREEIKTVIPKDTLIIKKEFEPDFTGKYPVNFYFVTNEFEVKPGAVALLKTVVNDVNAFPEYKVLISGFADRFGNPEYNNALSLKRAEALKAALVSLGVDSESIVVTGLGSQEASPDSDPQLDRRVEIQLFKIER